MPTYEYACRACGEHLEVVQSFRDDPLAGCPNCKGELRKVFSAAGLIFKGSGWHIKDYGTSTRRAPAPAESEGDSAASESGSEATAGGASESKAEPDTASSAKADTASAGKADRERKSA